MEKVTKIHAKIMEKVIKIHAKIMEKVTIVCVCQRFSVSLPKNKYFEVTGNVVFEITRAKMIEIE
jgi:hypothetical protein